eukprot:g12191.t2
MCGACRQQYGQTKCPFCKEELLKEESGRRASRQQRRPFFPMNAPSVPQIPQPSEPPPGAPSDGQPERSARRTWTYLELQRLGRAPDGAASFAPAPRVRGAPSGPSSDAAFAEASQAFLRERWQTMVSRLEPRIESYEALAEAVREELLDFIDAFLGTIGTEDGAYDAHEMSMVIEQWQFHEMEFEASPRVMRRMAQSLMEDLSLSVARGTAAQCTAAVPGFGTPPACSSGSTAFMRRSLCRMGICWRPVQVEDDELRSGEEAVEILLSPDEESGRLGLLYEQALQAWLLSGERPELASLVRRCGWAVVISYQSGDEAQRALLSEQILSTLALGHPGTLGLGWEHQTNQYHRWSEKPLLCTTTAAMPLCRAAAAATRRSTRRAVQSLGRRFSTAISSSPGSLSVALSLQDYAIERNTVRHGHSPRVCSSAEEAMEPYLQSDGMVFIHAGAATPQPLMQGMINVAKAKKLRSPWNLQTIHMHLEGPGPIPLDDPEAAECIRPLPTFVGANLRKQVMTGDAEAIPIHLRDLPYLFRRRVVRPDVALLHCSPPDAHGFCTLGTSVDWARGAAEHSKALVALINPQMPRVHGASAEAEERELSKEEVSIGQHIANLVPDGATLQMGIGSVPDAALSQLTNHKNLGIHTEMFSDAG